MSVMTDSRVIGPIGCERGPRGHRGRRGHDGDDGDDGDDGATGPTGPTGPTGAAADDGTFLASFRGGGAAPGIPVFISFVSVPGGITTVQASNVSPVPPAQANFSAFASVFGVVSAVNLDGTVRVATGSRVTLTVAQWNAMTGDLGGLTMGDTYFASNGSHLSAPFLTSVADPSPGSFTTRVGVALSATTMLVAPSTPVQNLGDQIVFAQFSGGALIIGSAVFVFSDNLVAAATSDVSATDAQAIGVIAAFDVNSQPIVQIAGTVTLTTAEWDAVTDTVPGMQAGTAYFVDTSANPGHLTANAPLAGAKVQVGVGFSTTQMVIAPFLQRL